MPIPLAPLVALAIKELPGLIRTIRELRAKQDPSAPPPTDEEVIAAFNEAYASSKAKDEHWLAEHPE